jgi:hypothetical protein
MIAVALRVLEYWCDNHITCILFQQSLLAVLAKTRQVILTITTDTPKKNIRSVVITTRIENHAMYGRTYIQSSEVFLIHKLL